ncbi:maleylacetoacetate isomerase [Hyphomonas sp.]|uniref:maleylacetoacetate isomerase n=1 Tax=Hyphomonas sp. TaxID=87 RepID=UPI0035296BBF
MRLYDYWRSSAAYRVRIALNIKGVPYEQVSVNLAPGADEQKSDDYRAVNPQMRVPTLEVGGARVGQSTAIFEWLEETYPDPAILPADPWERLEARSFANTIACDIHPLNNLAVLSTLRSEFGADDTTVTRWYHDWIRRGFEALEKFASGQDNGSFLFGDSPTIAEITLVPQIANARRFDMDLSAFPALLRLDAACMELDAFKKASPQANKPT